MKFIRIFILPIILGVSLVSGCGGSGSGGSDESAVAAESGNAPDESGKAVYDASTFEQASWE